MNTSDKVRAVLLVLGYTPKTLSEAIGVTLYKAKRILSDDYIIKCGEFFAICKLTGILPNAFMGHRATNKGGDVA